MLFNLSPIGKLAQNLDACKRKFLLQIFDLKVEVVTKEFTGKNLTRFGGTGLIRRFLKRHKCETRDYIGGILRNGRHQTSYNAIPFLKGIIKKLPSHYRED